MTAPSLRRVATAFRDHGLDVRATGPDSGVAQCPAHHDDRPRLVFRHDHDRVLIWCPDGCRMHEILDALGMHPRLLFDRPRHPKRQRHNRQVLQLRQVLPEVAFDLARRRSWGGRG